MLFILHVICVGLVVGQEGPLVYIGAVLGAGISQVQSLCSLYLSPSVCIRLAVRLQVYIWDRKVFMWCHRCPIKCCENFYFLFLSYS